MEFAW